MQNGKLIPVQFIFLLAFFSSELFFGQVKDSSMLSEELPSFNIDKECKSKSDRTPKPTLLYYTRQKLETIKTVKQLLPDLPTECEVICVFISIKKSEEKKALEKEKPFEFRNIGNEIIFSHKLPEGNFITIDHLATSCPAAHKANYKIIVNE